LSGEGSVRSREGEADAKGGGRKNRGAKREQAEERRGEEGRGEARKKGGEREALMTKVFDDSNPHGVQ
jgi:hypothetical protein